MGMLQIGAFSLVGRLVEAMQFITFLYGSWYEEELQKLLKGQTSSFFQSKLHSYMQSAHWDVDTTAQVHAIFFK